MSYTIGFIPKNQREVSAAEAPTANQALAMIAALQERAEEIKFITSPQEGEMGIEMLLLLASERGSRGDARGGDLAQHRRKTCASLPIDAIRRPREARSAAAPATERERGESICANLIVETGHLPSWPLIEIRRPCNSVA